MRTNLAAVSPRKLDPKEAPMPKDLPMIDRDTAVASIRAGLGQRSDRAWSVRAGRGTTANWITIIGPPARLGPGHSMTPQDCSALAKLLALDNVHPQGVMIEPGQANWTEYLMRAKGRDPHRGGLDQLGPANRSASRGPRPIGGLRSLAGPDERDLSL